MPAILKELELNTFSVMSKEAPRGVLIAVSKKELNTGG